MNRDYNDLKDRVGKFNKIIVTGPHGAGNKIMTKIISKDFYLSQLVSICLICEKKAERDLRLRSFFTSSVASV